MPLVSCISAYLSVRRVDCSSPSVFPNMPSTSTTSVVEELQKPLASSEDKFFWTYTEEPHRTRRQAIIKAHPEVNILLVDLNGPPTDLTWRTGPQALRNRAADQIHRPWGRGPSNILCSMSKGYSCALITIFGDRIYRWGYRQSESLPCYP